MDLALIKYFKDLYSGDSDTVEIVLKSIGMVLLFWFTVVAVYLFPFGIDKLVFVILLAIFWVSKSNYFWFAFFIIIYYSPSGFFQESSMDELRRLPIYNFVPRVSFSVLDLFLIVAFIKALAKGKRIKFRDIFGFRAVLIFLLYLTFISFFHGVSIKVFISQTLRGLFFYTTIFSFPSLVNTRRNTAKFLYMFFPLVFMELFSQIYLLYTGEYLLGFFYPESSALVVFRDRLMYDSIRSLTQGYGIVVLSFIFSIVLYDSRERMTSKYYLIIVMIVSSLSIFISATRQSILMFALIYFLYVFFVVKSKPGFLVQIVVILALMFIVFDFLNIYDISYTMSASFNRLTGAVQFQDGSLAAEDTLEYRLNFRLPILWEHIKGSLFLGYGYSDKYFDYYDGHLGGILIALLQAGVLGTLFYLYFVIKIYRVVLKYIRRLGNKITVTVTLKTLLIGITGLVFLNTFINPMFVINFYSRPQESFILIVLLYQFIYFGKIEYSMQKRLRLAVSERQAGRSSEKQSQTKTNNT